MGGTPLWDSELAFFHIIISLSGPAGRCLVFLGLFQGFPTNYVCGKGLFVFVGKACYYAYVFLFLVLPAATKSFLIFLIISLFQNEERFTNLRVILAQGPC